MSTKLMAALGAAVWVSASSAQILYWQVNPEVTIEGGTAASGTDWNYATLFAVHGGRKTQLESYLFNSDGSTTPVRYAGKDYLDAAAAYAELTGGYAGSVFFIELINKVDGSAATAVARSASVSYEQLGSALASTAEFNAHWSSINPLGRDLTFTVLPEPTSALMLLTGAALLGLRRQRPQV